MLPKDAADWRAAIENAAIMARAGPKLIALFRIIDELAEEGRLQRFGILLETADQIPGDEFRRFLGEKDIAVDEIEHLDRHILETPAPNQHDDRHFETASSHQIDQRDA